MLKYEQIMKNDLVIIPMSDIKVSIGSVRIKTAAEAVALLRSLYNDRECSTKRMIEDMIEIINRGIVPRDVFLLRLQIVLIRDTAIFDFGCQITTSVDSLEGYLIRQFARVT